MFKNIRNLALGAALLVPFIPAQAAQAKAQELIFSSVMMETHPVLATFVLPLMDKWERLSGNVINITYFNPGTICAPADMVPSTEKGVLSMTVASVGSYPATFPVYTVTNLPLIFDNSRAAALTVGEALATLPQFQEEMAKWYMILTSSSVPTNLLTTKRQVKTMEDIKGLKIGVSANDSMEIIRYLGGTPVQVQLNDMYLAMQRGMIDGCLLPQPTFRSTKVTEVGKYLTIVNMQCAATPLIMSRASYEALPAAAKKVMDDISVQAMSAATGCFPDYFGIEDTQWVVDNHGVQVYTLPQEERARWMEAVKPVEQTWLERARKQGVKDPEGLLANVKAIAAKYNSTDVQKETLDSYRDELGEFFPPENVYNTLWPQ